MAAARPVTVPKVYQTGPAWTAPVGPLSPPRRTSCPGFVIRVSAARLFGYYVRRVEVHQHPPALQRDDHRPPLGRLHLRRGGLAERVDRACAVISAVADLDLVA